MDYIFRTHYRLTSNSMSKPIPVVLLAETEPEACAMYRRHLTAGADLEVSVCGSLAALSGQLETLQPDLLIINPGPNLKGSLKFLGRAKRLYPALRIITLGYAIPEDYLDELMQLGVSAHINRYLSRPQDVALAAQQVLSN